MTALAPTQFRRIAEIARDRWGLAPDREEGAAGLQPPRVLPAQVPSSGTSTSTSTTWRPTRPRRTSLVFFDLLSTNVTSFFRDPPHFDYLEREFYTPLARGNLTRSGQARSASGRRRAQQAKSPTPSRCTRVEHLPRHRRLGPQDPRHRPLQLRCRAGEALPPTQPTRLDGISPDQLKARLHQQQGTGAAKATYTVAPHDPIAGVDRQAQPHGPLALQGQVRRHLLPKRDDLLRQRDPSGKLVQSVPTTSSVPGRHPGGRQRRDTRRPGHTVPPGAQASVYVKDLTGGHRVVRRRRQPIRKNRRRRETRRRRRRPDRLRATRPPRSSPTPSARASASPSTTPSPASGVSCTSCCRRRR
jgi:hypothetical protein